MCRHAEIQQEPHPTQFHHDSAAQNVSFDDAQAVAVASTGDVVTCRTELAPVADDRTQRIPGVGLAVLGFMGLFTVTLIPKPYLACVAVCYFRNIGLTVLTDAAACWGSPG